jgi:hypothetical protein
MDITWFSIGNPGRLPNPSSLTPRCRSCLAAAGNARCARNPPPHGAEYRTCGGGPPHPLFHTRTRLRRDGSVGGACPLVPRGHAPPAGGGKAVRLRRNGPAPLRSALVKVAALASARSSPPLAPLRAAPPPPPPPFAALGPGGGGRRRWCVPPSPTCAPEYRCSGGGGGTEKNHILAAASPPLSR